MANRLPDPLGDFDPRLRLTLAVVLAAVGFGLFIIGSVILLLG